MLGRSRCVPTVGASLQAELEHSTLESDIRTLQAQLAELGQRTAALRQASPEAMGAVLCC